MRSHLSVSILSLTALASFTAFAGCDEKPMGTGSVTPPPSATVAALATTPTPEATPSASAATPSGPRICPKDDAAVVADASLLKDIRFKLKKKDDAPPVTYGELKNITTLKWLDGPRIKELDPCIFAKLTSIKDLYLGPGDYEDLTPLTNLTTLQTLRISLSRVRDLKPLEKMVRMDRLDLGRTQVSDLSPVSKMIILTELSLDDTPVNDLTPLSACKKLETISIKNTGVTKLSPLKDMTKLKILRLEGTAITDLNTIEPLKAHGLKVFLK